MVKSRFFFQIIFLLLAISIGFLASQIFGVYKVTGVSMSPTLEDGHYVFVLKKNKLTTGIGLGTDIKPFDILVFRKVYDNGKSQILIKRCLGIPGETGEDILAREEKLKQLVFSDQTIAGYPFAFLSPDWGEIAEQRNELEGYFLVGDNYLTSIDSRKFGFVKPGNIIGVLVFHF